jgi:hypothetical protein
MKETRRSHHHAGSFDKFLLHLRSMSVPVQRSLPRDLPRMFDTGSHTNPSATRKEVGNIQCFGNMPRRQQGLSKARQRLSANSDSFS